MFKGQDGFLRVFDLIVSLTEIGNIILYRVYEVVKFKKLNKILLDLGDVREFSKKRPPKAASVVCFKTRFSRLSKLIPCLIRDYDIRAST